MDDKKGVCLLLCAVIVIVLLVVLFSESFAKGKFRPSSQMKVIMNNARA